MKRLTGHVHDSVLLVGVVSLLILAGVPHPVGAVGASLGDGIGIRFADPWIAPIVAQAIDLWRTCSDYGLGFPRFGEAGSGFRTIQVEVLPLAHDDRCGDFVGGRIRLYRRARLQPGRWRSCGSLAQNLAHELGHVLGLSEAAVDDGSIMISVHPWTNHSRRVSELDCERAGETWSPRLERGAPGRDLGLATSPVVESIP